MTHAAVPDRVTADSPNFVSAQGLSLTHAGRTILDHMDLNVVEGELLGVVGANGAGKSSLLRCLSGVWPATSGSIKVAGLDRQRDDLAIRSFTSYLQSEPVLLPISIRENLSLIAQAYGLSEHTYIERQDSLLRMFDLKERQDVNACSLSKGEAKKASIAAGLITGARLYLLDEPFTGGIDPRGHMSLKRVLERLAANRLITVVFASQILELVEALSDRIAVINGGRLMACGTLPELKEAARLPASASFDEVFARLASRDSDVPVENFMASIEAVS